MTITGPAAARQIQYAYQQAQAALNEARQAAVSASNALRSITSNQEDTLEDLAEHYLPELSREAINATWGEVRGSIESVLLRQQDALARLNQQIELREREREAADQHATESNQKLDTLLDRQQEVSDALSKWLVENEEFKRLTQRAAEAEAALERAEASLVEIEHEATQKLPAYQQSRLFNYLREQGFATPQYTSRGFTRRMDRMVSRLIDYPKAKQSYEYLTETPVRVRQLVAQDREALDVVMRELERQRDEAAERLGLPRIVREVDEADVIHQKALEVLAAIEGELVELRRELTETADPHGRYYEEAISHFREMLAADGGDELAKRAQETVDPRDDQIVARLEHLDRQFRSANTDAAARQQRIDWLDRHLADLSQFQQRFRGAGFDSGRCVFDSNLDLTYELDMVREGRDTMEAVWQRLRQRQRTLPSPFETAGANLSRAASHPLTHVLVNAMAAAATSALTEQARRAGRRHSQTYRHGRRL